MLLSFHSSSFCQLCQEGKFHAPVSCLRGVCPAGFYLLLAGDLEPRDVEELVQAMFRFIRDYEGPVPGAAARDCGNYLDMNLPMAKLLAGRYLEKTLLRLDEAHICYPE